VRQMRIAEWLAVLVAGATTFFPARACGQDSTRRDSAGVAIVTSAITLGDRPSGWTIDSLPDLQIGARGADPVNEFARITGISALPNGNFVVVDGNGLDVRFFTADGRLIRSVAGRGAGRVTFERAALLRPIHDDSIRIVDQPARTLTTFGPDGQLAGSTALGKGGLGLPIGRLASARIVFTSGLSLPTLRRSEILRIPQSYHLAGPPDWRPDTIVRLEMVAVAVQMPAGSGMGTITFPPFSVIPSAAVGRDDVFITSGVIPDIRKYDGDGRLREIFRVTGTTLSIPPEVYRSELAAGLRYLNEKTRRDLIAASPVPTHTAAWSQLAVDVDGNVWAQVARGSTQPPTTWVILSPDGTALGTVETPVGLAIHHIGTDFVLGVWRDADRAEHIRRYRLQKNKQ
jgi:hypothetical protein